VIHVHGLADPFIPFEGGNGYEETSSINFPAVNDELERWGQWNDCAATPQVSVQGAITHTTYSNCKSGAAVELYTIDGLEHPWPQTSGSADMNFATTQTIWDFFAAHSKPSDD